MEPSSIPILEQLLKLGVNPNAINCNVNTPAHRLITKNSFDKDYKISRVEGAF